MHSSFTSLFLSLCLSLSFFFEYLTFYHTTLHRTRCHICNAVWLRAVREHYRWTKERNGYKGLISSLLFYLSLAFSSLLFLSLLFPSLFSVFLSVCLSVCLMDPNFICTYVRTSLYILFMFMFMLGNDRAWWGQQHRLPRLQAKVCATSHACVIHWSTNCWCPFSFMMPCSPIRSSVLCNATAESLTVHPHPPSTPFPSYHSTHWYFTLGKGRYSLLWTSLASCRATLQQT